MKEEQKIQKVRIWNIHEKTEAELLQVLEDVKEGKLSPKEGVELVGELLILPALFY
jgi:hypothetical protein